MKMNDEEFLKEYRKEADFINNHYGLGDADHVTGLDVGHIYDLMRTYAIQSKPDVSEFTGLLFGDWLINKGKEFEMWIVSNDYTITGDNTDYLWNLFIQSKPDVSDEEIFNASSHLKYREHQIAYKSGAKWMRNKLTKF